MVLSGKDKTWCVVLCSALDDLRQSSVFSDVIISAEDGRIFKAHTCVLAAASAVLKTKLAVDHHQLDTPDISGQTWESVLHFVYTGEVRVGNAEELTNLLKASHQLGLTELAKLCGQFNLDSKPEASTNSKQHSNETLIRCEELVTTGCSGADASEMRHSDSVHEDPQVDIPQQYVTFYTAADQEDVEISVVDIQSATQGSTAEVIQLDALDMSSAAALDIQALLTQEIQLDSGAIELDADAIAREVDLGMLTMKKELDTDGQIQQESSDQNPPPTADELDSSNDDKGKVRKMVTGKGKRRRGKYKGSTGEYTCEVCGKMFNHLSRLKFHSNIHTGARPYTCAQCGKTFNHSSNLTRHERTHTGIRPHACPECGRGFQRASDMAVHVQRVHCTEKQFSCELCLKEFSVESDLKNHMYQHMDDKPFKCSRCDKSFGKMVNLVAHERTHTGERPYACKVCGNTFKDTSNLARHRRIHSGVKPFECSSCGKAFFRKADLVGHERIHTEEKPFVCSKCGKAFTFRTTLDMHIRMHTGEKPYMCAICGKTFTRNCNLLEHHTTHTGEKPFQCYTCGRHFATKKNLSSHERVHSESKPFECHLCGKTFRWGGALKKHVLQCTH